MTSTLGGHDPSRRVKESPGARMETDGRVRTDRDRERQTDREISEAHRTQPGTQRHRPSEDPEPGGGRREAVSPGAAGCSRWLAQRGAGRRGQGKTGMGGDLSGRAAAGEAPDPSPAQKPAAAEGQGRKPQRDAGVCRVSTAGVGGVLDATHPFQRRQGTAVPGGAEQICILGTHPGGQRGQRRTRCPCGLADLSESPLGTNLLLSGPDGARRVAGSRAATGSPVSTGPRGIQGLTPPPPKLGLFHRRGWGRRGARTGRSDGGRAGHQANPASSRPLLHTRPVLGRSAG